MSTRVLCVGALLSLLAACSDSETSSSSTAATGGGGAGTGGVSNGGAPSKGGGGATSTSSTGGAGAGAPVDCTDLPDFRRCQVETDPDRFYDICSSETCVSPGCGTASCNAPGPHFPLADTGQRNCYDMTGTAITCGSIVGCTTLCGQDGQVGWDPGHVATTRFSVDTDRITVTDSVTELVWQGCPAGTTEATCEGTATDMTWSAAVLYCDELTWGMWSDWRLPNEYELHSLIDYGRDSPAIDDTVFLATPNDRFVSSSTYAGDETGAWYSMFTGTGQWGVVMAKDTSTGKVRCVRDSVPAMLPSPRFERSLTTSGEPVVIDNVTDLEWQGCEPGLTGDDCMGGAATPLDWGQALDYCHGLTWAEKSDWHLPNVKQLRSIIDNRLTAPGLAPSIFPNHLSDDGWSSTTDVVTPAQAWTVDIADGGSIASTDKTTTISARCMRFR